MGARSSQSRGPGLNKTDGHLLEYFRQTFGAGGGADSGPTEIRTGLTATGGIISDYSSGSDVYRAHVFTSSGIFDVSEIGSFGNSLEYLVVAGGGGGGGSVLASDALGAGGAGGLRSNYSGVPEALRAPSYTVAVGPYTVTIGGGGNGGQNNPSFAASGMRGYSGGNSEFYPTPVSYPSTLRIRAVGGGGGGAYEQNAASYRAGIPGGSAGGGGGGSSDGVGGTGNISPDPNHPKPQGNDGGDRGPNYGAGGGGGFTAAGVDSDSSNNPGPGGAGISLSISGISTGYAGGGGGGAAGPNRGSFSGGTATHGGGTGAQADGTNVSSYFGTPGTPGTGGGGGGGGGASSPEPAYPYLTHQTLGGIGGSGVVVVSYQIGTVATQKATGGVISYYSGKTIHTFTSSGTFTTSGNWADGNVEYVAVAGGGGGNQEDLGGAGGAGGFITGSTPITGTGTAVLIVVGAGGGFAITDYYRGGNGNPSYVGTPLTAYGGGGGAGKQSASDADASPGGSGGGGDWGPNNGAPGDKQTGTSSATPITPQGYPGGNGGGGSPSTYYSTGGGGGAGGAGGNGGGPYVGGAGGLGRQIPSTFRNPMSATSLGAAGPTGSVPGTNPGGDTSGKFWFAGGGGGGTDGGGGTPGGGGGGSFATPYAGGGPGGDPNSIGGDGKGNTGGGGGATDNGQVLAVADRRGNGGSGIVLIAYPT